VDLVSAGIAVNQLHAAQASGFARLSGKCVCTCPQTSAKLSAFSRSLGLIRRCLLVWHERTLIQADKIVKLGIGSL
jgi:hypothetical protein